MSLEDWQRPYVQRALDCHNKQYVTDIAVRDRYEEFYPEAKDKNWDWVAVDKNNSGQVAIEVKQLTNPQLQGRFSELDKICHELSSELSSHLKGVYILSTGVSEEEHFDLKGANKQRFKENLRELILKEAQTLETGGKKDLATELRVRLSGVLPQGCYFKLQKLNSEASYLDTGVNVSWGGPSRELRGKHLDEFCKLVKSANDQLAVAKARDISDTFLIILDIGYVGARASVLQNTLRSFDPSEFPHIKFLYLVGADSPPNTHELFMGKA